jgi:hypothetical protein
MSIEREPIVEALDGLMAFIDDLDLQVGRLVDAGDTAPRAEKTAPVLARLRGQRLRLAQVEAMLERSLAHELGTGQHSPAGIPVKVHGGWVRTDWQHRDIARLLAEAALVDEVTGELDPKLLAVVMPAVYRVIEAGRMDWRVTDLKEAGLNPDEGLCKREHKRMTVQLLSPAETR